MKHKILLISIYSVGPIIFVCALNFFVIEPLVIPDECYYHTREAPFLIDLFYDFPSSEGGHPIPNTNNVGATLGLGVVAGLFLALRKLKSDA